MILVLRMNNHYRDENKFFLRQKDIEFDDQVAHKYLVFHSGVYGMIYYDINDDDDIRYFIYDKNRNRYICVNATKVNGLFRAKLAVIKLKSKLIDEMKELEKSTS